MRRKERYNFISEHFRHVMPEVTTELEFGSAFQLLCATILSAQCTDKRVNMVTPTLFLHYPTAHEMAKASQDDVLEHIASISYPNSKSRHLVEMARILVRDFHGEVPADRESLTSLPGVGRKTANVMRAVWFGLPAMAVVTHVFRVSHRLGLVPDNADTPVKVEKYLVANFEKEDLANAHHWLILHGRYVCLSRKPKCGECPFSHFCPSVVKENC